MSKQIKRSPHKHFGRTRWLIPTREEQDAMYQDKVLTEDFSGDYVYQMDETTLGHITAQEKLAELPNYV